MGQTPCKNCQKPMPKTQTIHDPKFDKLAAYFGANPRDFEVKVHAVSINGGWNISLIVQNLADSDADPISIQLT